MAWFLATADIPGKPFAVIDGEGSVAGCHATRAAAMLQMTALNMDNVSAAEIGEGASGAAVPDLKKKRDDSAADSEQLGKPWLPPAIPYTTPKTQMW